MKIKTILGVALVAGSFASCSVEDNESASAKIKEDYTREFIKQFGTIDRNQDWSVVEQKSVTVDLAQPAHVKIYEKQGGGFRLAADYKNVTKQTITFDGLEGDDTPFLVSIDDAKYYAENGGTVSIKAAAKSSSLRTSVVPSDCNFISVGTNLDKITLADGDNLLNDISKDEENHSSLYTLSSSYTENLKPNQSASFYPVYWNSEYQHTVGIYYYDDYGVRQEIALYKDKEGEDLAFYPRPNIETNEQTTEEGTKDCWEYKNTTTLTHWSGKWTVSFYNKFSFLSRAFTVTPTVGLSCGIFVEVNGKRYYSDKDLNDGNSYFAYRQVGLGDNAYTYIAFDDPDTNDKDFNDLVLYTPRTLTPSSKDEIMWTVACEDLGGTFDYDFNDIVFRVRHTSGNDFLTIIPMAAGGTLPATLCYKNEAISEEWHQHFGNGYESNVMLNTGMNTETVVWPIRLEGVPTDWSMKAFTSDPTAKDGDFSIVVERADGTKATVTGPSQGVAPQMLILPYEWQWPTELTRITTAYPNFGTWGSNYSNSSWVNSKVSDYVVPGFGEGQVTATKAAKTVTVK